MAEVIDLDILVPEPKVVRFGATDYQVPADMPMEIFLRVNLAGTLTNDEGEPDQVKQMEALIDTLSDLFTWEQPEGTNVALIKESVASTLRKRGVKYAFELMRHIYKEAEVEEADEEGPPDQAPEAAASNGTPNSTTSPSPTVIPAIEAGSSD